MQSLFVHPSSSQVLNTGLAAS